MNKLNCWTKTRAQPGFHFLEFRGGGAKQKLAKIRGQIWKIEFFDKNFPQFSKGFPVIRSKNLSKFK